VGLRSGRVERRACLAKLLGHLRIVANHGLPDIPWLQPASERLIDGLPAQLRMDDVARVGIRVRKVLGQSKAELGDAHG